MIKHITKSFIVYMNEKLEILFAQCRKTGKFVKRALAKLELEAKTKYDEIGCTVALLSCVLAIINAVVFASDVCTIKEMILGNALFIITLFNAVSVYIINKKLNVQSI